MFYIHGTAVNGSAAPRRIHPWLFNSRGRKTLHRGYFFRTRLLSCLEVHVHVIQLTTYLYLHVILDFMRTNW